MSALVVFSLLPQGLGMANHCPQFLIRDHIWPKDAEYMAESFIHKRLQFGKQSFG